MGLLDSFEKGLDRAVNSAFAKTFRSGIQAIELAAALRRELDTTAQVVSRERILVPSDFSVRLHPSDLERMRQLGTALDGELREQVEAHAAKQGYSFAGPLRITLTADEQLAAGTVQVDSRVPDDDFAWRPVVVIDGVTHPLVGSRTIIGRGSDADITINDSGASRAHIEILWDGARALVRDLGSTNGTMLDGQRFGQAALAPEQTLRIGRTDLVFKVVPTSRGGQPGRTDDGTTIFPAQGGRA